MNMPNSLTPSRRLHTHKMQWMIWAQLAWVISVCVLGGWWGWLLVDQAGRIEELERQVGIAITNPDAWTRTRRMVFWESSAFLGLLLISTGMIFWLYWRDLRRARGLQAFFASVTHELRTPLTSIRLQAESIAEAPAAGNATLVRRLLEDTLRLESQVERTLELARVEGGGPVYSQSLELQTWADRALQPWREMHRDRFEFDVSVGELAVEADPRSLGVILRNLLENSIRHGRHGSEGRIRFSVRAQALSDQRVELAFRDDGQGFDGDASRLGEIFEKGPHSQGAGVGLYLIRMLMKRMGGEAYFGVADPNQSRGFETRLIFRAATGVTA